MPSLAITSSCPNCGSASTFAPGLPDVGEPCAFVALYDRVTGDLKRIVKPSPPTLPIGGAMGRRCERCGPFVIGFAPL